MPRTTPQASEKRKRLVLTLPKKIELVKRMEKGESRSKLMAEFGVSSSTLYDLKKQKAKLLAFVASTESPTSLLEKRKSLKRPKLDELDRALYLWFTAQRSEGKPVTGPMVILKAKKLKADLGIETECNFSLGWLHKFKARHGIRRLEVSGERRSADTEAAERYAEVFANLIRDHGIEPDQVYNADETALFWRCLPSSTLASFKEKEAVGFKQNKDRLTILTCANATGSHKVKLFVLGKFKNPRALKNVNHLPVHYNANANAWMTADLFKWWFFHVFVVEVKQHLREKGLSEDSKVLLVLDNCRAHPPVSELVSGNIFVAYLPPNVTSLIQPMDQGIIQNFKHFYRSAFIRELVSTDVDVPAFQKSFTIKDAIFAAAFAWRDVTESTLSRCWHKLWPERLFEEDDGEEDDDDFHGFEAGTASASAKQAEQLRQLTRHASEEVVRNVNVQELEEWLQADSEEPIVEELTDEAIVSSLRTPSRDLAADDDSDAEQEEQPKISWEQGHHSLKTFVQFVEQSSAYSAADVMSIHILMNDFLTRRAKSLTQQDIRKCFERAAARKSATPTPTPSDPPVEDDDVILDLPSTSGHARVSRSLQYSSDSE